VDELLGLVVGVVVTVGLVAVFVGVEVGGVDPVAVVVGVVGEVLPPEEDEPLKQPVSPVNNEMHI